MKGLLPLICFFCFALKGSADSLTINTAIDTVGQVFEPCYPVFREIAAIYADRDNYVKNYSKGWPSQFDVPRSTNYQMAAFIKAQDVASTLRGRADSLRAAGYDEAFEKERLCRQLSAFRDTATVLLPIYTVIEGQYKGNIQAYVDALFSKSVMTNKKALKRFLLRPTVRQMQRDMGFQFVVSKLMYRAWEAQGRP